MPQINNIPEVLYEPNQPYHYIYDNLPLRNILKRIDLVNSQVDTNTDVLRGASGNAGSLDERLEVSLDDDGHLKSSAVDACKHSIEEHEDTTNYVRMTSGERGKLDSVENSANKLYLEIDGELFSSGTVIFENSGNVLFENTASNIITANVDFPTDSAHRHYYAVEPYNEPNSSSSGSGLDYKTTITNTPFTEGSLRVYVNGFRLSDSSSLAAPVWNGSSWASTYVTSQNHLSGSFSLNRSLGASERIFIDFDESF